MSGLPVSEQGTSTLTTPPVGAPQVSVIMSVYNGEPFVQAAVRSILEQTFQDFEFIVIDDGSSDGTAGILATFDDPRMTILRNDHNMGRTPSLNRGLQVARGPYIARQDADDVSLPERLTRQVAFLESNPHVGLVGTTTQWIDEEGNYLREWPPQHDNRTIQETLLASCCFIHGSVVFRREALVEAGGYYDESLQEAEDYELWLRLTEGWDAANLPQTLYRYRWHSRMASFTRKDEQHHLACSARHAAIRRRLTAGWAALKLVPRAPDLPTWVDRAQRGWLAERYTCWSSGARQAGRWYALQFLLIALLADPTYRPAWRYLGGVLRRKLLGSHRDRPPV